jgi:hypothetical protein
MKFKLLPPSCCFSYPKYGYDDKFRELGFEVTRDKKSEFWITVSGTVNVEFSEFNELLDFLEDWPKARLTKCGKQGGIKLLGWI